MDFCISSALSSSRVREIYIRDFWNILQNRSCVFQIHENWSTISEELIHKGAPMTKNLIAEKLYPWKRRIPVDERSDWELPVSYTHLTLPTIA